MFLKEHVIICQWKVEKYHSKVGKQYSKVIFFVLLPWTVQAAQTEEFMIQNVAYRPTVYKTGTITAQSHTHTHQENKFGSTFMANIDLYGILMNVITASIWDNCENIW